MDYVKLNLKRNVHLRLFFLINALLSLRFRFYKNEMYKDNWSSNANIFECFQNIFKKLIFDIYIYNFYIPFIVTYMLNFNYKFSDNKIYERIYKLFKNFRFNVSVLLNVLKLYMIT